MTRRDISRALRRFWPLALGVFALFVAIGAAASFLPHKRYQAEAMLFAEPTSAEALNNGTSSVVAFLIPTIEQQIGTQEFKNQVVRAKPTAADATLSASNVAGTGVLIVTAESTDPHAAADAANAAAEQLHVNPLTPAIKLTVLNPALTPTSPTSPKATPIMIGCIVVGLILGLFATLLADSLRKRVAGAEMIRDSFGLAVLGEITSTRRTKLPPPQLFAEGEPSAIAEEYERLRTNFELLGGDCHTVAVTSWTQGEGKTTVTANLGWLLASLGREVTIVDFDLRRPAMHVPFDLELAGGVSELSSNGAARPLEDGLLKPTLLPQLNILTAGLTHEQPTRQIEVAFPTIMRSLDSRLVLIDTPPLLAAETSLIASMVDALVIVIDVRRREPAELESLLQVLKLTHAKILGVVLNRAARGRRSRQISGYYHAAPRTPSDRRQVSRTHQR